MLTRTWTRIRCRSCRHRRCQILDGLLVAEILCAVAVLAADAVTRSRWCLVAEAALSVAAVVVSGCPHPQGGRR